MFVSKGVWLLCNCCRCVFGRATAENGGVWLKHVEILVMNCQFVEILLWVGSCALHLFLTVLHHSIGYVLTVLSVLLSPATST